MGFLDELFGDTPKGNYETKDTTTLFESLFGERSAEVRDTRTDEVGKGKGDNMRDAKSSAFHHLKEANPYDPNYTSGPKQEKTDSSTSSSGGGRGYSSGGGSFGGGGGAGIGGGWEIGLIAIMLLVGGPIGLLLGFFGESNKSKLQTRANPLILEKKVNELPDFFKKRERLQHQPKYEPSVTGLQPCKNPYLEEKNCKLEASNPAPPKEEFKTSYVDIDPKIIQSFHRFVKPSDLIDLHDGSVAIKLDSGGYYRVEPDKLEEMDEIYKGHLEICQNALYNKNRYKSRKTIEFNVRENLKTELRKVIRGCEKIEPNELATNINN